MPPLKELIVEVVAPLFHKYEYDPFPPLTFIEALPSALPAHDKESTIVVALNGAG
jgi:hypothetical protein